MAIVEWLLPEFDQEMANTRKVLELVPDDRLSWKPHPEMQTIGWVATHLCEIVGWVEGVITQENWDYCPPGQPPQIAEVKKSREELLRAFDVNVVTARAALESVSDEALLVPWSLLAAGETVFAMPRQAVIRSFVMNHLIHHRAFLIFDLRLCEIKTPGMYGP